LTLELPLQDLGDLARPEKLVLEVDEPLSGAKRTRVGLQDPELAAADRVVDPLWNGAYDLDVDVPGGTRSSRPRERIARDRFPTLSKVGCHVGDGGSAQDAERVVPAHVAARLVRRRVDSIARVRGQVDAP